jgi:hypothetical protein
VARQSARTSELVTAEPKLLRQSNVATLKSFSALDTIKIPEHKNFRTQQFQNLRTPKPEDYIARAFSRTRIGATPNGTSSGKAVQTIFSETTCL